VIEIQLEEMTPDELLRRRAIKRLKKCRDFAGLLLVYFLHCNDEFDEMRIRREMDRLHRMGGSPT
jgi:hypothetical protein